MRLYGEVAEHERTDHGKRVGKDAGGVERGELEEVDNELGQEELGEDGDLVLARDGEEAQRAVGKVRVLHEQIPHGRDEEREQKDDHAQNAEVRADERREIEVVRLLHEIKEAGGQDHGGGGVVHEDDDAALHDARGGGVGALSIANAGKRVEPLPPVHHGFGDGLLRHGDGVRVDGGELRADAREERAVHLVLEIAEDDVGAGFLGNIVALERQLRRADAAAQERRVLHEGFDEAVVRAAQHLARGRLLHAAGGVALRVDEDTFAVALGEEQRFAEEHGGGRLPEICFGVDLAEGHIAVDEGLRVSGVGGGGQGEPEADHALEHRVVAVAVHDIQTAAAAARDEVAGDHVKAALDAQQGVERADIQFKVSRQALHGGLPSLSVKIVPDVAGNLAGGAQALGAGDETLLLLGREAGVAAVGVDVAREEGFEQGVAHALIGAKFGIGSHREDLHSAALPCAALRRRRMESLHTARLPPVGVPQMPGAFV